MELGNIIKAATFKSFLHTSYENTQLLIFVIVPFNIFMRQTLTNYFGRLHKNMNCAFPLSTSSVNVTKFPGSHLLKKFSVENFIFLCIVCPHSFIFIA